MHPMLPLRGMFKGKPIRAEARITSQGECASILVYPFFSFCWLIYILRSKFVFKKMFGFNRDTKGVPILSLVCTDLRWNCMELLVCGQKRSWFHVKLYFTSNKLFKTHLETYTPTKQSLAAFCTEKSLISTLISRNNHEANVNPQKKIQK
jgi:hypothetical protein